MKHAEPVRLAPLPKPMPAPAAIRKDESAKKPSGPVTYTVSKGADVFWPGKGLRTA